MNEVILSKIYDLLSSEAIEHWKSRRIKEIQDVLLKEVSDTGTSLHFEQEDDFITIIEMFLMAQRLGAAKENLRLMARTLRSFSISNQPIYPDKFRRYAKILAELTSEEIITLVAFYNIKKEIESELSAQGSPATVSTSQLWSRVSSHISNTPIISVNDMLSAAYSCQRYGLLIPEPSLDGMGYLKPTKFLDELIELSNMQARLDIPI